MGRAAHAAPLVSQQTEGAEWRGAVESAREPAAGAVRLMRRTGRWRGSADEEAGLRLRDRVTERSEVAGQRNQRQAGDRRMVRAVDRRE
jgi:hypothetical protein